MKKLILMITMFAFTGIANAQSTMDGEALVPDNGVEFYIAAGLSLGNSTDLTFGESSYASLEFGLMKGNWALGLVVGRGNNDFRVQDDITNYCWEIKNAVYFPIGDSDMDFYALFGVGNYVATPTIFIEYGGGFSYMPTDHIGLFMQASNWDNGWYVTQGLSYSF